MAAGPAGGSGSIAALVVTPEPWRRGGFPERRPSYRDLPGPELASRQAEVPPGTKAATHFPRFSE